MAAFCIFMCGLQINSARAPNGNHWYVPQLFSVVRLPAGE